jgi:hypothetical protein
MSEPTKPWDGHGEPPFEPPRRAPNHGKGMAIAAFVVVALAGILIGAALDRYFLFLWRDQPRGIDRRGPNLGFPGGPRGPGRGGGFLGGGPGGAPGGRPGVPPAMSDRLARDLQLSAAQHASIDSLLDRQAERLRDVRERMRPTIDSMIAETEREVKRRLTPEQRTKYQQLLSEMRPRGRGRGERPPIP